VSRRFESCAVRDPLSVRGKVMPPGKVYSLVHQESLSGLDSVVFLAHLLRVTGQRLLVLWDNSPIPRGTEVRQFWAEGAARWIPIEALPPYAPDLNPVEWMWTHQREISASYAQEASHPRMIPAGCRNLHILRLT